MPRRSDAENARIALADRISRGYAADPVGYAKWYLNRNLWAKQRECCELLLKPPYRVLCRSANNVGKTFVSACVASWWHDNFRPSIVLTTAPTQTQVRDLLFKELRAVRPLKQGFLPRATRIHRAHDWYVHGFTAATPDAFHGRHSEHMLLIFDEATGIRREFWDRAESMFGGHLGHGWLAIYNPNDISSPPYTQEQRETWHHVNITALEHPNIAAELVGLPPPYPSAIRLSRVLDRIATECEQVRDREPNPPLDFEFPAGSRQWYTPQSPEFEVQILGRWPAQPIASVWTEKLWAMAAAPRHEPMPNRTQIGCDVARFGDDETTIHVRQGGASVAHEWHKGWNTDRTAHRLRELCHVWGKHQKPTTIPVCIDVGGVGGGVVDQGKGYNFIPIHGSHKPREVGRYPNARSELWFVTADIARAGLMDLSRLPPDTQHRLKVELFAPTYSLDSLSRRRLEDKDRTKQRLGKSPDNADAFNLAYYVV